MDLRKGAIVEIGGFLFEFQHWSDGAMGKFGHVSKLNDKDDGQMVREESMTLIKQGPEI